MKRIILPLFLLALPFSVFAQQEQNNSQIDTTKFGGELSASTFTASRKGNYKLSGVLNSLSIGQAELSKAACCNLGESFTTNPSVDVSYSDPATGAKQIKLLGLSGKYVQMLTDNIPNFRGLAQPFALGYVPGTWMQGIQVSTGSSSVKNGYESITGQINVEHLKPTANDQLNVNLFGDSRTRHEVNFDGNIHLNDRLSTGIMAHYENTIKKHDDNGDGFMDTPNVEQYHIYNTWAYITPKYLFHAGISALKENRRSGQIVGDNPFRMDVGTQRYEFYTKNAYIFDSEHNSNLALIFSGNHQILNSLFGRRGYDASQDNLYGSLMFETDFTPKHNLSTGLSLNYDNYNERLTNFAINPNLFSREVVPGAYAQYTFNDNGKLIAMAGIRVDYSSVYGTFVTPRAHIKYAPVDWLTLRLSAGKGYRSVHPLAENSNLLASGREVFLDSPQQEEAWNFGFNSDFKFNVNDRPLALSAQYYHTRFLNQVITDYDSSPFGLSFTNLDGKSYSNVFQVDGSYEVLKGLDLSAAFRLNDVYSTYGGELLEVPMTSRYKGLVAASYKTPLELWQFDLTLQFNGGGRMPKPYTLADGTLSWAKEFPAYQQLNAQITRYFRHFSVYIGGENLTGFTQKNPIIAANDPYSRNFEPTLVWGPLHGAMVYLGIKFNLEKQQ